MFAMYSARQHYIIDLLFSFGQYSRSNGMFPEKCIYTLISSLPIGQAKTILKMDSFSYNVCSVLSSPVLSSPRAKRAGPKGLRAESARAFTGRRCPHSGKGEDFLSRQQDFFTETAVTPERKVKKSFPRWEINRHAEGFIMQDTYLLYGVFPKKL